MVNRPKIPDAPLLVPLSQLCVILPQLHMASSEVLELKVVYISFDTTLFSTKCVFEKYGI